MIENFTPDIFRGIERLGTVVFGGLSVYWGYKLFSRVAETAGELALKGNGFSLGLKNVAPGVFFAVFGMVVLTTSLVTKMEWTRSKSSGGPTDVVEQDRRIYGQGGVATGKQIRLIDALQGVKQAIVYIEKTSSQDKNTKGLVIASLQSAKVLLLEESFSPEAIQQYRDRRAQIQGNADTYRKMTEVERLQYEQIRSFIDD